MLVEQYVYFALSSERTTAQEMTGLLGVRPDETTVRGSRSSSPVRPVCHRWRVVCRKPGLYVDDQVACVLHRLRPHTDRIAGLARRLDDEPGGAAVLEVVRRFRASGWPRAEGRLGRRDRPAGFGSQAGSGPAAGSGPPEPSDAERRPGLLGWHLDREVLDFLTATGAALDVDEYGYPD